MATFYIHWPFCVSKCAYCNFNSYIAQVNQDLWLEKYKLLIKKFPTETITSIYFGGGTPSLLQPRFVEEIINAINPIKNAEITIEINPNTVDYQKLLDFKYACINRVSIGVQSIYDDQLQLLGRTSHTVSDAISCVKDCCKVFDNVSIDLIYNRPFQTCSQWGKEITQTMEIFAKAIQHISCYELILEPGTPLTRSVTKQILPPPLDCDTFFKITHDILDKSGFKMYEISNFAKNGFQSKHNLSYWKYDDYYGIGPGAHSRITKNGAKIAIKQGNSIEHFTFKEIQLSEKEVIEERLIMGLRTIYGVESNILQSTKIQALEDEGYAVCNHGMLTLTFEGLKRLNGILRYLLNV